MSCHAYATTNERLQEALVIVDQLIDWAQADAEHATESDAPDTARDDRRRVKTLRRAHDLLTQCTRA